MKVYKDSRDHKWYARVKWKGFAQTTEEAVSHLKKPGNCTKDILREVEEAVLRARKARVRRSNDMDDDAQSNDSDGSDDAPPVTDVYDDDLDAEPSSTLFLLRDNAFDDDDIALVNYMEAFLTAYRSML